MGLSHTVQEKIIYIEDMTWTEIYNDKDKPDVEVHGGKLSGGNRKCRNNEMTERMKCTKPGWMVSFFL